MSRSADAGKRIVVLDNRVMLLPVPTEWLDTTRTLRCYAGPTDPEGVLADAELSLGAVIPLAPLQLEAERVSGDDVTITWTPRGRSETGTWPTGMPFDLLPAAYVVTILDGASPIRTIEAPAPSAVYTAAAQSADFGTPPASFDFTVAQISAVHGPGYAAEGAFNA
jgi:hypothetical protein